MPLTLLMRETSLHIRDGRKLVDDELCYGIVDAPADVPY